MSDRVAATSATVRVRDLSRLARAAVLMGSCWHALGLPTGWAKDEAWRQEGPAAFTKSHREGVVVSDSGRVRLGHAIAPLAALGAERVWDLARIRSGALFACTGDAGKVFRREPTKDAAWTVHFDSSDSQALCLAVCPDGTIFAGDRSRWPGCQPDRPQAPGSRPDPKVQYIWDLAADQKGNLYAATGPNGQLWKRASDGKWSLVYDSKATHLLCVAIGPDGSVYAGSDGEGLIYRVAADSKVSILFDAPQSDVRTLSWGGDGALYAGTAAEAGGATNTRSSLFLTQAGVRAAHSTDPFRIEIPDRQTRATTIPAGSIKVQDPPDLVAQTRPQTPRRSSRGLGDSQTDLARR